MDSGDLAPVIILTVTALVIGWIVKTISSNHRLTASARQQGETQAKLLERFGTAPEMQHFLESPAGRRFLESSVVERSNPVDRILSSVQTGILVLLASAGFYACRDLMGGNALAFLGTVGMLVGAGFLLSAGAVYFLSRGLGLELGLRRRTAADGSDNDVAR